MPTDQTYEGWSNYPTWCANLWLTNTEWTAAALTEICTWRTRPLHERAGELEGLFDEITIDPSETAGPSSDLLGWARAHIEWTEIVRAHEDDLD